MNEIKKLKMELNYYLEIEEQIQCDLYLTKNADEKWSLRDELDEVQQAIDQIEKQLLDLEAE